MLLIQVRVLRRESVERKWAPIKLSTESAIDLPGHAFFLKLAVGLGFSGFYKGISHSLGSGSLIIFINLCVFKL
jgi:hypothetical protein